MTQPRSRKNFMSDINVLLIVATEATSADQSQSRVSSTTSSDGVTVNVFDSLGDLPAYRENIGASQTSAAVEALCTAAAEAHATIVLTDYRERVPSVLHTAIDWLTGEWNHGRLHDKPLAVVGRGGQCYSGVWSHHATGDDGCVAGFPIVESITEPTLSDVVRKLVGEVNAASQPSWALPVPGPAR
jgi:hypothetical protein